MTTAGSKPKVLSLAEPVARDFAGTTAGPALCGNLQVVPIFDVVQWVCSSRQSWQVFLVAGGIEGRAAIVEGELVDAHWGDKIGHEALVEILNARSGRFELQPLNGAVQRSLRGNWILTLLTAAQQADEHSRIEQDLIDKQQAAGARVPRSSKPPNTNVSGEYRSDRRRLQRLEDRIGSPATRGLGSDDTMTPGAPTSHLIDQGFLAMKAGDIERARTLWKQALAQEPENRMLQFNLRKLDSLRPAAK
jgi:hypothetical protein